MALINGDGDEAERTVALKTEEGGRILNGGDQWRCWAGLNPELLALIFVRVKPVDEMVRLVPLVCRPWREVLAGPDCWAHIDVERWCRRSAKTPAIDSVVRKLVLRSRGTLRTLSAYKIGYSAFFHACSSYVLDANFFISLKVQFLVNLSIVYAFF